MNNILKEDLQEGKIIIGNIDPQIVVLLIGYNHKLVAYTNLFKSYIGKTIDEFYNFDEERFFTQFSKLKQDIEIINMIQLKNIFGDLFDYLNNNFKYIYRIDEKTNCMIIEILKQYNADKGENE